MSKNIYRRSSDRYRVIVAGGAVAIAGCWSMPSVGIGAAVAVAIGLVMVAVGVARGGRPLVSIEPSRVLVNFTKPIAVPFHTVASVDLLEGNDLSLSLRSGARVFIPVSRLEDVDGAWLRRALRREVRDAQRIEQARISAAPYSGGHLGGGLARH
ncbi:MAG: hypothetical protein HYS27_07675 [Deltaproteobacteria bacterium]|nr:hypothetical protein [Deltaproteobacteria bacterium]